MLGIVLAFIISFLKALGEFAGKIFIDPKKESKDELTLALGGRVFGAIVFLPLLVFIDLPGLSYELIGLLLFSSLIESIATVSALKAVKYSDIGVVGPLSAITIPLLILTGFVFLGEIPNISGIIGIILIMLGIYFLGIHKNQTSFLEPILAIYHNTGARYMLLTAVIWSVTGPIAKIGVDSLSVLGFLGLYSFLTAFWMCMYSVFFYRKGFLKIRQYKNIKKIGIIGILGGVQLFLQYTAIKYTLVVYVIAIKRASGIFSVLLGAIFLKEKDIIPKLFAALIMVTGVVLIVLNGNI